MIDNACTNRLPSLKFVHDTLSVSALIDRVTLTFNFGGHSACGWYGYMDHIRRILNKCNISTAKLELLSTERDTWKSSCASGLATYNVAADQAAEDRRTRRHSPPNPPTTGQRCPQSSRICASEFGLCSHLRSHASLSTSVMGTKLIF